MNYKLHHLGAENTVTGSCHLLQLAGLNILVDCGIAQGHDSQENFHAWPVNVDQIDYCFITHAHIDHIGRLPDLIANGFSGEIICTHPTKSLLLPMLNDAMGFSEKTEAEKQKLSDKIDEFSWGFEYNTFFQLKKGIQFKLGNTGHILGACFVHIFSDAPEWSVVFSGDIGGYHTPILPDPDIPQACNLLVMESTYGNRNHGDRKDRIARLGKILTRALADRGKVFIPAFSLGRTQELIYELDRLFSDSSFIDVFPCLKPDKKIPVFIDSPLGTGITEIYSNMWEFWDVEATSLKMKGDHPIDFDHLYAVKNYKDHLKLLDLEGPHIIIAGSGMANGGRILDHLKTGIEIPENDILFVGYQAEGTTGRDILRYSEKKDGYVWMDGERKMINANVESLSGYSAHADQKGLLDWVAAIPQKPEIIKLVHGDPDAKEALQEKLTQLGYNAHM